MFDCTTLSALITQIDTASHGSATYCEKHYLFLKLLLSLRNKAPESPFVKEISEYINQNLENISSLSDICKVLHYSKNYVIRIFNHEFGVSPIKYINEKRIERAMYLLETSSSSIGAIASKCGFSDYPYFYKLFVQKNGLSPAAWRRQFRDGLLQR